MRHTYSEQKRKLDAMKILTDKAIEINTLFLTEDMRAGTNPGSCEYRRALARALSETENALQAFSEHVETWCLIDTPINNLEYLIQPDSEESRNIHLLEPTNTLAESEFSKSLWAGMEVEMPAYPVTADERQNLVRDAARAEEMFELDELEEFANNISRVTLPGAPNPEIAEDDLPF